VFIKVLVSDFWFIVLTIGLRFLVSYVGNNIGQSATPDPNLARVVAPVNAKGPQPGEVRLR
jgi:hypothetical protein